MNDAAQCNLRPKEFHEMCNAEQMEFLKDSITNLNRGMESLVALVDRLARHTHDAHGNTCIHFDWPRDLNRWR